MAGTTWLEAFLPLFLLPFAWINRDKLTLPVWENLAAAGCYFVGYYGFASAISRSFVSLAVPITNLFPAVSVLLAMGLTREKLRTHQKVGFVLALASLAILGNGR